MVLPVHQRERVTHELEDVRLAAHGLEFLDRREVVDERDGVDRDVLVVHLVHGEEERLVRRSVEVIGQKLHQGALDHLAGQHHGCEHVGLGLGIVGRRQARAALEHAGGAPRGIGRSVHAAPFMPCIMRWKPRQHRRGYHGRASGKLRQACQVQMSRLCHAVLLIHCRLGKNMPALPCANDAFQHFPHFLPRKKKVFHSPPYKALTCGKPM